MRKLVWTFVALSGFAAVQSTAHADHNYGSPNMGSPNAGSAYSAEQSYHDGLAHRNYDRQVTHDQSHNYRMGYRQHNALHGSLSHQAYHDNVGHQAFDRSYGAGSYGGGYGQRAFGNSYGAGSQYSTPEYGGYGNGGGAWSPRW